MKRRTILTALALIGGASATGCGSSGGDATAATTDTLRYVSIGSPATASDDPHGGLGNESDALRFALVYDVLTGQGPDGRTVPRLAESWQPDDTLTRWRFTLRKNATFSDGRPVRAADVLYSLRRIERKAAENYGRLSSFDMAASRVIDDHTVEIVSRTPFAEVPRALESMTFIVPDGSDDFTAAVPGSGPFRLVGNDGQTAVLERRDGWWGPAPSLRRVEVRAVADPQARAQAVLSGQVDVAASIAPAAAKQAEGRDDVSLVRRPAVTMYPFVMRLDRKPFDDPRVREAIKLAADRPALVESVYLGYGQTADDVLAPADPSAPNGPARRARDLAKAKQLLAEAGHAGGLALTLHTTTSYPGMDTAATLFAGQLAEAGITANVRLEPPDTYFTTVWAQKDFYTGYFGGIPFFDVARVALLSGSPTNETAWRRPEFDTALNAALAEPDETARNAALGVLQQQIRDEGGYVVWGTGEGLDLTRRGVEGLPTGAGFGRLFIDQVRISG
ncbi:MULTISPECIES: ABC transporter substrate-binding protein [Catenuloplanes]|uniref:Peptide/nickel transport system substrate-binding protein n=1 Tax=Catenuloplanes niger TaxID=587534 RepID=A0AAE3ZWU0_9ACTN|nr:ABC transporter substrate-binding protein [Catenuloplanes niger]MDR7327483.1 peptide/nickel transport system substrate-binding protein [Catenuloplanes niger]